MFRKFLTKKKLAVGCTISVFLVYFVIEYSHIRFIPRNNNQFTKNLNATLLNEQNTYCADIPNELQSKVSLVLQTNNVNNTDLNFNQWNISDGAWRPSHCQSKESLAIIIPYRSRLSHLKTLITNLHPFLQHQEADYQIFVIDQNNTIFNRGMLLNIGYVEALKMRDFDCFIFHDVDLIPENEFNFYRCIKTPRHLSVAVDKFKYKLLYPGLFGGAIALTKLQFHIVNGFSNQYYGWGGEDDDMYSRIANKRMKISRFPNSISRYTMIKHGKDKENPDNKNRFKLLKYSKKRQKKDGLNTLTYEVLSKEPSLNGVVYWITVDIPKAPIIKSEKVQEGKKKKIKRKKSKRKNPSKH